MNILFKDHALGRLCREERLMRKKLGDGGARKPRARLKDLLAAENLGQV